MFAPLKQLEELDISSNKINSLVNGVFSHLVSLRKLDLSSNEIENIENDAFYGLKNMIELDISFNANFRNICLDMFRGLFRLNKFHICNGIMDSDKIKEFKELFGDTLRIEIRER